MRVGDCRDGSLAHMGHLESASLEKLNMISEMSKDCASRDFAPDDHTVVVSNDGSGNTYGVSKKWQRYCALDQRTCGSSPRCTVFDRNTYA